MKNIYIKIALFVSIILAPVVSSASNMLDPYPINANDNRSVYNASVTTSLALAGRNQNQVYTTIPAVTQPAQVTIPAQTMYTTNTVQNTTQPAAVYTNYSNLSANSGIQTYVGVGTNNNSYANNNYTVAQTAQPVYANYTNITQPNTASNSWTYNLPNQSLVPASVAGNQYAFSNQNLVAMDTSYKYSYANSLPSYYGAGATSGVYTVYGGQNYDASNIYNRGLALATGTTHNTNRPNMSGVSSGDWVQTSGLANSNQYSNRRVSGHLPW
ncbi:MAG: hypothetical protein HZA95_03630 [Candidatus Vogelbacteria bacterium]|nr:hypothetical protein [Candidatus Vogelbacteria bacterium]